MRAALRLLSLSLALAAATHPQSATAQTDTRGLVFVADLGEDGNRPEPGASNFFHEHWTFTILPRAGDRWDDVYTGGGGGC